jgi:serine/threonine protein kinase
VVRYLGIFKDHQQRRYIVTEFMTKGSLLSVVDVERESITTQDLLRMYANASHLCADKKFSAKQAANGMQFLEENKIIHRDIGLRNFLVRYQRSLLDFLVTLFVSELKTMNLIL